MVRASAAASSSDCWASNEGLDLSGQAGDELVGLLVALRELLLLRLELGLELGLLVLLRGEQLLLLLEARP